MIPEPITPEPFVRKELYQEVIAGLRADIAEIKDSQKWMMRLLVAQFFGLVTTVMVLVATRGVT